MAKEKDVKATAAPAEGQTVRKKRTTDGKRGLTFVYTNAEGKVVVAIHRTAAFSVEHAWKEFLVKHQLKGEEQMHFAFPGQHEPMENKIRKPTRTELLKLAGLE